MTLALVVDSLDELEEEDREKYVEQEDGGFRLKAKYREGDGGGNKGDGGTGSMSAEEVADLKDHNKRLQRSLEKDREERRALEREMRTFKGFFEEYGDKDSLIETIENARELEHARLEKKGEWDALKGQMVQQYEAKLADKDRTIENLRKVIDENMRGRAIAEAIAKADGNPTLLQPILLQKTRLVGDPEAGDDLRVEIFEGDTPLVDSEGNRLSIEGFVKRLREDDNFSGAFRGTGSSGGGSSGDGGSRNGSQSRNNGGGMPPELANFRRSTASTREKVAMRRHLETLHPGDQRAQDNAYFALPE